LVPSAELSFVRWRYNYDGHAQHVIHLLLDKIVRLAKQFSFTALLIFQYCKVNILDWKIGR